MDFSALQAWCYHTTRGISRKFLTDPQMRFPRHAWSSLLHGHDLDALAKDFKTDKNLSHFYTQHYQKHFGPIRHRRLNLLEIGIGGYDNPWDGGQSLRMWKAFFPKAMIYGLDIHSKSAHNESRIKTFQGSQTDAELLHSIAKDIGGIDIIIDDGSHLNAHVTTTFNILFPLLNDNGIYAIEDLQTSYWETDFDRCRWDGSHDLNAPHTSMNMLKRLVDGLNYEEFEVPGYQSSYFDRNIFGISFYHNLAFIQKGSNCEGSNRG